MEWLHWTLANAVNTLAWWASDEPWKRNGHNMVDDSRPIQVSVRSDAATETYGWGGTVQVQGKPPLSTRGNFTAPERKLHINALELLGCWFTIKSLLPLAVPRHRWPFTHINGYPGGY